MFWHADAISHIFFTTKLDLRDVKTADVLPEQPACKHTGLRRSIVREHICSRQHSVGKEKKEMGAICEISRSEV